MDAKIKHQFGWAADCQFDFEQVFMKMGDTYKGHKLVEAIELIRGVPQRRLKLVKVNENA